MTTDQPPAVERRRKRTNRRLRAMLALIAMALGLYVYVRLDRSVAERLGPVGEGVYDLFNQVPGKAAPLTPAARRRAKAVSS